MKLFVAVMAGWAGVGKDSAGPCAQEGFRHLVLKGTLHLEYFVFKPRQLNFKGQF